MNNAFLSDSPNATIHECRCCDLFNRGLNDGTFGHDPKGPWRRIGNIDGRNAICPTCQADPEALDHLVHDGYDHACILVDAMKTTEQRLRALEKHSHVPFDFSTLVERIEWLEAEVSRLKGRAKVKRPKVIEIGSYVRVKAMRAEKSFVGRVYSVYKDYPGGERIVCVTKPSGAGVGYRVRNVTPVKVRL